MSPEETRKNQIRKFMKLTPMDRLSWCLNTGHEILSLLPEAKRKKYLEFRKVARRSETNSLGRSS
ncbi:MAG TPA: hypothetical protein DCZ94_20690 [Lentisphaeria bacterium]|nr:MAG: hypothetical protein A2X48_01165 [Lentisphaerae bacterium GWF2_49_21]HBC89365.1 hypothetical protein [Lentisphaeria bacterium]